MKLLEFLLPFVFPVGWFVLVIGGTRFVWRRAGLTNKVEFDLFGSMKPLASPIRRLAGATEADVSKAALIFYTIFAAGFFGLMALFLGMGLHDLMMPSQDSAPIGFGTGSFKSFALGGA